MFSEFFDTPRLILRPVARDDAVAIFEGYAQDPEVSRYTVWMPHRSLADAEAFVGGCLAAPPDAARTYAICEREKGALLGVLALRRGSPHHIELGYVLARRWWRQGLMTEAARAVVDWALRQPSVFRVSACCDVDNIGSARVMEKAGLVREGLLRRWLVHPNVSPEPRDCFLYAKVR